MYEVPQMKTNTAHDDQLPLGGTVPRRSTGPGADKARLIPTALAGPAQQGQEPCPIILPRIAIGVSVAPNVPALFTSVAAPSLALEHRPTLVLTPITNEEKGQDTGAHEQHPEEGAAVQAPVEPIAPPPPASPGQERGYPVITTPIPTPGDLSHTTPFPSAPVRQQGSPRKPSALSRRAGQWPFLVPACTGAHRRVRRSSGDPGRNGDAGA